MAFDHVPGKDEKSVWDQLKQDVFLTDVFQMS